MRGPKKWLILILILGFLLRVYRLNQLELFGDELDVGYQAYSLWTTGRDYLGQRLPFYLHSFSEWRAPLLMYFTAPFVGVLGLNHWGVRLPPLIFGVFNILLIYLLVKDLAKDENLGLIAALVLAITPWHIHYSRAAFEVTLLLLLILLGTLAFLRKKWLLSAVSFALSLYTYNTANVFVPLWLLALGIFGGKKIRGSWSQFITRYSLMLVLAIPLGLAVIRGQGSARFRLISIFNNPKTIDQIVFRRTTGLENRTIERIFHNKLTGWGKEFITNYLTVFSPQFLFLAGDSNPRHNPPGFGEFYWILAPFLVLGVLELSGEWGKKNKMLRNLVCSWLLLAPIPSCLTTGGGNQATRLFLMLPPLVVLIALGIKNWLIFPYLRLISGLFVFFSLVFWLHNYWVHYPKEHYQWWHYGYQEAMTWVGGQEDQYQRVIINNSHEPALLRYLFWTQKSPSWLMANFHGDQSQKNILPDFDGFQLGKVIFGSIKTKAKQQWLEKNLTAGDLYLAFQGDEVPGNWNWQQNPPPNFKILKAVYDPWGKPMIYWITKK